MNLFHLQSTWHGKVLCNGNYTRTKAEVFTVKQEHNIVVVL